MLDRKKKQTLAHKRSFFVRMVSDPKIYNPTIAKALPATRRHLTEGGSSMDNVTVQLPVYVFYLTLHFLKRVPNFCFLKILEILLGLVGH